MKRKVFIILSILISVCSSVSAQAKKILVEINSIHTKETITFKYNSANQLIYFDEKAPVTYREFTLKYDKINNRLTEYVINQDKGELMMHIKYAYNNKEYVDEEIRTSGKNVQLKSTDYNKIYIDEKGRLTKTAFDDGKIWEEFAYDDNNNLLVYKTYSAFGDSDKQADYKFDANKSIFSNMQNLPPWFWALHMNNMRWSSDFIGNNNAVQATTVDPRFGTDTFEISYKYDSEGYPIKQFYDGELVKEFKYKIVN